MTHTFVHMPVAQRIYDEISGKLRDAGYAHAFINGALDMHGIALIVDDPAGRTAAEKRLHTLQNRAKDFVRGLSDDDRLLLWLVLHPEQSAQPSFDLQTITLSAIDDLIGAVQ